PLAQVVGHIGSEIAGPAFDPSGRRLYFSSQRAPYGMMSGGITYEVTGPFA
ncbi:MAG: translocation protein TolB, partial [Candidatus Binatia bacterium]